MTRPNILVVMSDQQQADVVLAGHPCRTPHADRMAAQGVRFTHCFTPTAHCCPSRASFHTGLMPSRHGVHNNIATPTALSTGLAHGVVTFGSRLRSAGYELAFAGKWHVDNHHGPADHGWRELVVTAGRGAAMHPPDGHYRQVGPDAGPRAPGTIARPGWGPFRLFDPSEDATHDGPGGDEAVVRSAIDALPGLASSGKPWCMFVGTFAPHDPFSAPGRFVRMYDPERIELPASYGDDLADKPRIYQRLRRQVWDQLPPGEVRQAIARYWAACTWVDDMLGRLLAALEATGQADHTLVLFLSDHGDYAGAHGLFLKGVAAFREAYHVPCIARWPKGIAHPGRQVDAIVSLADFAPTFCEVAGVATDPAEFSGRSIAPFFAASDGPADWPTHMHTQFNGVELYYTQRAVWNHSHKYVHNGFDYDELYDLQRDPGEMVNRIDDPSLDEVKRELVRELWRFAIAQGDRRVMNPYGSVALAPWGPGLAAGQSPPR